ncbi:MAG: glycosyl hydrolase 108 family protein [Arenicellales bacterium]
MADFSPAIVKVLRHEGGYSDHPEDKGGETYKGISRVHNPSWPGWVIIDNEKQTDGFKQRLDHLEGLQAQVNVLYRQQYWDPLNADKFKSQSIAEEVFDTGVNMHWRTAARFLQSSINLLNRNEELHKDLVVDGMLGKKSLKALSDIISDDDSDAYIMLLLNLFQGMRYINILSANPAQEKFTRGWINRTR